jgi:hypothetical protein
MQSRQWPLSILSAATMLVALSAQAQEPAGKPSAKVVNTGTTPKPISWPSPPLPDGPIPLDTGIERNLRMVVTK